jgi:hypothetical protein
MYSIFQYLRVLNCIITVVTFLTTCQFRCLISTQSTLIHFLSILIVAGTMPNGPSWIGTYHILSASHSARTYNFGSTPGPITVVRSFRDDWNQIVAKNY